MARLKLVVSGWPAVWPTPEACFDPLAQWIAAIHSRATMGGHQAILRFSNGYGVNIFKSPESDFFEMTVIRFHGPGIGDHEFVFDTPIPDLNLGYGDADILELCEQVSKLNNKNGQRQKSG